MKWWMTLTVIAVFILVSATAIFLFLENQKLRTQPRETEPMTLEELPELSEAEYNENVVLQIVSDTEYSPSETGQLILRITDIRSRPLSALCFGSIAYPNKTLFITNQSMGASAFSGNYYYNFTVPSTYGIYEEYVECYVNTSFGLAKATMSSSFHVSDIRDQLVNMTTNITGSISNATNTILNQMNTYYISLYNLIQSLPSSMIGQFETQTPTWFKCIAQKITGVFPAGSECKPFGQ